MGRWVKVLEGKMKRQRNTRNSENKFHLRPEARTKKSMAADKRSEHDVLCVKVCYM